MEGNLSVDFFANGLFVHCNLAMNELEDFFRYHSETELSWKKLDDELQKKIDGILSNYPEEHHQEIIESHSWDLHINQYKFPKIHRKSILITIYNFVENQLNQLCQIISESIDSKIKLKHLHGQGIERAFLYLSKVGEMDFSKMGQEMPFIRNVNEIRNIVVHNGGIVPKGKKASFYKFISNNKELTGEAGKELSIGYEFINELIKILINFFKLLENEVQLFIKKANA